MMILLCLLPAVAQDSSVAVVARVSDILGEVDSDLDLNYGDLWGTGLGMSVESDVLYPLRGGPWRIGGYVSAGFDVFQGDEAHDELGDTLKADNLTTGHLLLGFKVALASERGFFFDGRAGVGPVLWLETEGELRAGGPPSDVEIFSSSVAFGAEFASHVGYATRGVIFSLGFALRGQTKPDSADLDFDGLGPALVASVEAQIVFRF